jgi:hypothetical protein
MDQEKKSLKDLLAERADAKGLNLEKLFQATEVPKHYLEAIFKGDWKKLPASPYARGYFKKLAPLLNLEPAEIWDLYENETDLVRASGAGDRLPENRFAIKRKSYAWAWPALAAVLIIGYLSLNLDRLLGRPELSVDSPLSASLVTAIPAFTISGKAGSQDKLFINNEEVFVEKSGEFQKNYSLQPGLNTFEIMAKRFLGRETKVVKQIIYQPQQNDQKGR